LLFWFQKQFIKGALMFDLNKLGDLSKMANQAKEIQKNQERQQGEQIDILRKISKQLEEVVSLLKQKQ